MSYPTVTEHEKLYPYTSIMAFPYAGDPTGVTNCAAAFELIKTNQSNLGTIYIPRGTFRVGTNLTIPIGITLEFASGAELSIDAGITLTISGPIVSPAGQYCFTGSGTLALGSTFSSDESERVLPPGTWAVNSNITVPANITLKPLRGAVLAIATTKTLTINGSVEAGPYQIFSCTGTGAVAFADGVVYPVWWKTNTTPGTTDMSTAIQAALDSGAKLVQLGGSTYKANSALLWDITKCALQGQGAKIDATDNAATCLTAYNSSAVAGSSYAWSKLVNSGWELEGDVATNPNSIGLSLGEYNTNELGTLAFKDINIHGFGKNVSQNQLYAYGGSFNQCNFYEGTYGIYISTGGEATKLVSCKVFNNGYGLYMAAGGEYILTGGSINYNTVQDVHVAGGAIVNAFGLHIENSHDADYWLTCLANSGITLNGGRINNASVGVKTKEIGYSKDTADAGIHLNEVAIANVNLSTYGLDHLVKTAETSGGVGVSARNLIPFSIVTGGSGNGYFLIADKLNLLVDGDFEDADLTADVWTLSAVQQPTVSATAPHGGTKCVKFNPTAGNTQSMTWTFPCRPGDKYRLLFWIKTAFAASTDTFSVVARYIDAASNGLAYGARQLDYATAGVAYPTWTRQWLQPYFPAPAGAVKFQVYFTITQSSDAPVVYIDDMDIQCL